MPIRDARKFRFRITNKGFRHFWSSGLFRVPLFGPEDGTEEMTRYSLIVLQLQITSSLYKNQKKEISYASHFLRFWP